MPLGCSPRFRVCIGVVVALGGRLAPSQLTGVAGWRDTLALRGCTFTQCWHRVRGWIVFRFKRFRHNQRDEQSAVLLFVAFWIILVFVIFQAAWWVIFALRSIDAHTDHAMLSWQQSAVAAHEWFVAEMALHDRPDPFEIAATITSVYPDLTFDTSHLNLFHVKQSVVDEFLHAQHRKRLMFIFEAPFFALVVLVMLILFAVRYRQANSLQRRQANFLSAVTHELRTPLSSIRLIVQTLALRDVPREKQLEYLRTIEQSLTQLDRHTDNLLATAQLDYNEHTVTLTQLDLGDTVTNILDTLGPSLSQRGARIHTVIPEENYIVRANSGHLALILRNFLDNAVKYTPGPEKPITVTVDPASEAIHIHVDDAGAGIDPAHYEHLFTRFYRAGDELTRNTTGLGLGLFLAADAARAMHATVQVRPNPAGKGSRFTVSFPRRYWRQT